MVRAGAKLRLTPLASMALAFHILAHREPAQVARLLGAIWHPDNTYVIHYDRRRPHVEHAAIASLSATNVLIQHPTPVLWGRFSLYAAQHEGLHLALESGRPWTHWFNLSGQCYPLQPIEAIMGACAAAGDQSYVRHFQPLENGGWKDPASRLTGYVLDSARLEWLLRRRGLGRRLRRIFGGENALPRLPGIRRALPDNYTWFGGDNWVTLARSAAEYLVSEPRAAAIIRSLRRSAFPEESIVQTVLMDSPCATSVVNDHRRAIKWRNDAASPSLFTLEDWNILHDASREGCWFARKFEASSPVLDLVDTQLLSVPAMHPGPRR